MEDRIKSLEAMVADLSQRLALQESIHSIRRLQHVYGYYLDKCLYNEVVDLFAESGEVRFMGGIYRGKDGVKRLYCDRFQMNFTGGKNGPVHGFVLDHPQMQDVIDVAADGLSAQARFRCLMQAGLHESVGGNTRQWWEGGLYENTYVKEDGIWKFKVLDYRAVWHGTFEEGWAHTPVGFRSLSKVTRAVDPCGPDELSSPSPDLWPATDIMPFHYKHPVTGKVVAGDE